MRAPFLSRLTQITITTQLAAGITFLFVLVIVFVGTVALRSFKNGLYQVLVSDQQTLLKRVAEDLDNTVLRLTNGLVASAKTVTKADIASGDAAQRFLDANTGLTALFDRSTFLFSTNGRIIAEHPWLPNRRGENVSYRDYIYIPKKTLKPVVSEPFVTTKKDRNSVVVIGVPVLGPDGKLMAIHTGSIGLTKPGILSNIYTTTIGQSGYLFLVDKNGKIIMFTDKKRLLERLYPPNKNSLFEAALKGEERTGITIDPNGRNSLVSYKRIHSADWVIGAVYPEDEAFAAYNTLVQRFFILLFVASVIALVSVLLFTRGMLMKLETTNKKLEKLQTEATDKLKTRSQFFQEASHDFKQRLHAMQLLVHTTIKSAHVEAPMLLAKIESAVSNMKNYVAHFLEFTQLETSANQPIVSTVHLQSILQKLEVEFEDVALQKKVDLKIRFTRLSLMTDEKMLLRIIENLLSNAIKFARSRVLVGIRKSNEGLSIEVWDDGPGIPPSKRELVFEAFYRNRLDHGFHEGVGLGLAIVKRLATCLNYRIKIFSVEGKNNVVKIIIPSNRVISNENAYLE